MVFRILSGRGVVVGSPDSELEGGEVVYLRCEGAAGPLCTGTIVAMICCRDDKFEAERIQISRIITRL